VYSCFDINCMDLPTASTFKGNTVHAPLESNTGVVRVGFTRGMETFLTSAGFIASFAGTPLVSTDLQVGVWHYIASSPPSTINTRGTYTLFVNETQERVDELPLEPNSMKSALVSGRLDLGLDRGAPD